MISNFTRFGRFILTVLVCALVMLALAVTTLRILLPQMNRFQHEIEYWVSKSSGFEFTISDVKGSWRNTHLFLSIQGAKATPPSNTDIQLSTQRLDVEFNLIQSILSMQPVVSELKIYQLELDISTIDWSTLKATDNLADPSQVPSEGKALQQIDNLFLKQLDDFTLTDSLILYPSLSGQKQRLEIARLRWKNEGVNHWAEGEVNGAHAKDNAISIRANFEDHGSLRDISGQFYVTADNANMTPWLSNYLKNEIGITDGKMGFNGWFTLSHQRPVDAYVELKPSFLRWGYNTQNELHLNSGYIKLFSNSTGWKIKTHELQLEANNIQWKPLNLTLDWQPEGWTLNLPQLDINTLTPLMSFIPNASEFSHQVDALKLSGELKDIRIYRSRIDEAVRYSAQLNHGAIAQWKLLPELHNLSAKITGNHKQAHAHLTLMNDILPYGDVFQAPLNINQSQVNIIWQQQDIGWSLWADNVTVATPELNLLGAFRLDYPSMEKQSNEAAVNKKVSPHLSFYAEAQLSKAEEIWRYLPPLALKKNLTNYLSEAIQGGEIPIAKLLWFGDLADFPYSQNDGIFQAWIGLKNTTFIFDKAWPSITDLQLDLLFENQSMFIDSNSATLMNVAASKITGRIAELNSNGQLEIEAKVSAQGSDVSDYMLASPLKNSVGSALKAIQIKGKVASDFQLKIPFNRGDKTKVWGWAAFDKSDIDITMPAISLSNASGTIQFNNDAVSAAQLKAQLLNQPVSIDFKGENSELGYDVNINVAGNWNVKPLEAFVDKRWLERLQGSSAWKTGIDIQLNPTEVTYQIDTFADFYQLESQYPSPLTKELNTESNARLQVSGNQQSLNAYLQLPNVRYQADINIASPTAKFNATHLMVGIGEINTVDSIKGHQMIINEHYFNADDWLTLLNLSQAPSKTASSKVISSQKVLTFPMPDHVELNVKNLTLAGIEWHDVNFMAQENKHNAWQMTLDSQEAKGEGNYTQPNDLSVNFERLHIYLPQLESLFSSSLLTDVEPEPSLTSNSKPLISDFDRQFHRYIPNIKLNIDELWLQGYKVGIVNMDLQRQDNTLEWRSIDINSGDNDINISSSWTLENNQSHTQLHFYAKGKNNSELMERFGINSGIQRSEFEITSETQWEGAPWSMKVNSLAGTLHTKLGNGVISNMNGAVRLLGLFSLDSLIRKMQLDFSDVFDEGMVFNAITGDGEFSQGIFVSDNIKMDAVAGDMTIKGVADLNTRTVDAEVNFVPDMTSGIPVLTAFAVTPQIALYVLAVTTIISPVVEVFTQVSYEVKGSLNSPTVTELSRSKGTFQRPR